MGVSGQANGAATPYDPTVYDPATTVGSLTEGSTGSYRVSLHFGQSPPASFTIYDNQNNSDKEKMFGDQNHFRDQGQLIIDSNRIAHSRGFGIEIGPGNRDAGDGNQPHPGSVRHLDEINSERLVPGVVVTNNLLTYGGSGGIHFSGDTTQPGEPLSAVPFGRIVNNTVYGSDSADTGILVDNFASPTLLNNIVANASQGIIVDASSLFSGTIVGGSLYQNNGANTNYNGEMFQVVAAVSYTHLTLPTKA